MKKKIIVAVVAIMLVLVVGLAACSSQFATDADAVEALKEGLQNTKNMGAFYWSLSVRTPAAEQSNKGGKKYDSRTIRVQNDGEKLFYARFEESIYTLNKEKETNLARSEGYEMWWSEFYEKDTAGTKDTFAVRKEFVKQEFFDDKGKQDSETLEYASYDAVASIGDLLQISEYSLFDHKVAMAVFYALLEDETNYEVVATDITGVVETIVIEFKETVDDYIRSLGLLQIQILNISDTAGGGGKVSQLSSITNNISIKIPDNKKPNEDVEDIIEFSIYSSGPKIGMPINDKKTIETYVDEINNPVEEEDSNLVMFILIGVGVALVAALVIFILVRRAKLKKRRAAYAERKQAKELESQEEAPSETSIESESTEKSAVEESAPAEETVVAEEEEKPAEEDKE